MANSWNKPPQQEEAVVRPERRYLDGKQPGNHFDLLVPREDEEKKEKQKERGHVLYNGRLQKAVHEVSPRKSRPSEVHSDAEFRFAELLKSADVIDINIDQGTISGFTSSRLGKVTVNFTRARFKRIKSIFRYITDQNDAGTLKQASKPVRSAAE